ncbi:unnamed protein product [Heligmosomoides polygyrus]|uniref:Uncharacterized protein n=1 Tax=Heligmosomoides polygyrus TaxID=6339 RepID=A0A183FLK0_HELPZ|nr:unnamed protein product [Heligmosomoides polygyrus]
MEMYVRRLSIRSPKGPSSQVGSRTPPSCDSKERQQRQKSYGEQAAYQGAYSCRPTRWAAAGSRPAGGRLGEAGDSFMHQVISSSLTSSSAQCALVANAPAQWNDRRHSRCYSSTLSSTDCASGAGAG